MSEIAPISSSVIIAGYHSMRLFDFLLLTNDFLSLSYISSPRPKCHWRQFLVCLDDYSSCCYKNIKLTPVDPTSWYGAFITTTISSLKVALPLHSITITRHSPITLEDGSSTDVSADCSRKYQIFLQQALIFLSTVRESWYKWSLLNFYTPSAELTDYFHFSDPV